MKDIIALLRKIELYTAGLLFMSATFIMFISVFFRLARRPLFWSLDIVLFLAAWSIFLAADCALQRDKLVRVDIFVGLLPEKGQKLMQLLCYAIILVFLIICVWYGSQLTWTTRRRAFQGIPGFSFSWVTLAAPVGFALMSCTVTGKIKELIKSFNAPTKNGDSVVAQ